MTTATTNSLIYAAEAWVRDEDSDVLRPSTFTENRATDKAKQVVERVVEEQGPVVIRVEDLELHGGDFNALVGIPTIRSNTVLGCLVLAVNCPPDAMGAFEIWKRDDRDELGLNGAVFAGLSRFASISQHVRFPRGSGLPGQSWEDAEAKMLTGLGSSPNFMRAAGARAGGLDIGVALPIFKTEHDLNSVFLLLSAQASPIASTFEIWNTGSEVATLRSAAAGIESSGTVAEAQEMTFVSGEGIVGKVWESARPLVCCDLAAADVKRTPAFRADGLSCAIALPIFVGARMDSVFVMFS